MEKEISFFFLFKITTGKIKGKTELRNFFLWQILTQKQTCHASMKRERESKKREKERERGRERVKSERKRGREGERER